MIVAADVLGVEVIPVGNINRIRDGGATPALISCKYFRG